MHISLPWFYQNRKFNNKFYEYIVDHPESLWIPINIESAFGAFPFSSWNGDINSNWGDLALFNDFYDIQRRTFVPIRLDCTNLLLDNQDLYDRHQNIILEACKSGGNLIEFADLKLFDYIKEHYKQYLYVVSNKINLINPISNEIINEFTNQDDFYLISILEQDLKKLDDLKNKDKIEIILLNRCQNCAEERQQYCLSVEQDSQINFFGSSIYQNCHCVFQYGDHSLEREKIINYLGSGYDHFKLDAPPISLIKSFNMFIIRLFIKEEYWFDCLSYIGDNINVES